jgi:hypothetical protein
MARLRWCLRGHPGVFLLLWIFHLFAATMTAQSDGATIEGFVVDTSGGVVSGAVIEITHLATHDILQLRTNPVGRYMARNLPIGTYRVTAKAEGFQTALQENLQLPAQSSVRLDFTLNLGNMRQVVLVESEPSQIDASTPAIISTLTSRQVADLPVINVGAKRNIGQWLQFLPGVNNSSTWGARVNGANGGNSEIFLDGAPASQGNVRGGIQETGPDVETVAEFSVVTNSFSPEYGRTGAWFTNIVIKSGTNEFHGSIYDHFANDALNARSFFQAQRSELRQNDGGFTIGGPLYVPKVYKGPHKTFFFFGQELFFYRQQGSPSLATVPTQAFRTGNFSSFTNAAGGTIPIFDPNSTASDGSGGFMRTQFAGNIIPASRISPVSNQMMALLLPPDIPGREESNFHLRNARIFDNRVTTAKVDHNFTPNQRLSTMTTLQTRPSEWTTQGWGLGLPIDGTEYPKNVRSFDARVNYDYIIRPNLLNHLVIGGDGMDNQALTSSLGQGWDAKLGITGLPADPGMFPNVTFSGGTASPLGLGGTNYSRNASSRLSLNDNLTLTLGRHTLKFGGNFIRERYGDFEGGGSAGVFGFNNLTTSQPDSVNFNQWGSSFASFLLGDVNHTNTTTISDLAWRINYQAFFLQDEWRATSHLTLSYGVRYERYPGVYEEHDRATSFNPTVVNPGASGLPGALTFAGSGPGRTGQRVFANAWNGVAPRLGVAYEFNSKTVVRASGGIFFAPGVTPRIDATGFTATPSFSSPDGFSPVYNWANTWPQTWVRPPFTGPSSANGQTVSALLGNAGRPPQVDTWTFSIQRQLEPDLFVEASYVGTKSTHLELGGSLATYLNVLNPAYLQLGNLLNQSITSSAAQAAGYSSPFASFSTLPQHTVGQALRPYPQYAGINMPYSPEGISSYNALQLKLAKRYSNGLTFLAFYTRSKLMTNDDFAPVDLGEGPGNIQNPLNRMGEYSVSQDDYPNVFGVSFSYELPFGPGKPLLNRDGALGRVIGGWQIAGSIQRQSGAPLSVTAGTSLAQFGFPIVRANYNSGQNVYLTYNGGFDPSTDRYLNANAFSSPGAFQLGDTGRVLNWVRGPMIASDALSLQKTIFFTDRIQTVLRVDATNPFNIVRWTNPNTNINDANFGAITSTQPGRVVQFSVLLRF